MDLGRISALVDAAHLKGGLGNPPGPRYIQVAGTNGKGSVTAMLQSMLIGQGYRTGGFFSPFVYDPRERIQIGGELIPKELFAALTDRLWPAAVALEATEFEGPTEFEFKTALGIAAWLECECEWVALEVGLGGRLDATSVVTPACGVIVSIGHDHMNILGDSLSQIAREKAGILKPGMPCVVGSVPDEALVEIEAQAARTSSELWRLGREILLTRDNHGEVRVQTPIAEVAHVVPALEGDHQLHNAALAIAAMELSGAAHDLTKLTDALQDAKLPGRMESRFIRGSEVILDGAHNPEAARAVLPLVRKRLGSSRKLILISAMLEGHDPEDFYREFAEYHPTVLVPPIDFFRSRPPEAMAEAIAEVLRHSTVIPASSVQEAIHRALELSGNQDLILVTGSFYLVGEVGNAMQEY